MQHGKTYQCPECPYATHQRSALQMHLNIHPGQRLCCPYCPYRSDQIKILTQHLKSHKELHTPEEPNMPENDAKEDSARNYSNDAANELKDPEDLDQIYPKDATNEIEDPLDLYASTKKPEDLDHSNEVDTNLKKPTCSKEKSLAPTAGFSVASSPPLSAKPHLPHEKKHQCPECSYSADQHGNLLKHIRTHTGEKPFCCPHCGHRCTQKSNLNKHVKAKHRLEELPMPEEPQAQLSTVHKCEICYKMFYYKAELIEHEREHNRVVSYSCPVCGLQFSSSGNMIQHYKQH